MLVAQRDQHTVVGRRRLELEVEGAAEAFAKRQAPGSIDASAEGRVNDQLHAAGLVEEPLGDDRLLRGQRPERRAPGAHVGDELLGTAPFEGGFLGEES